VVSYDIEYEELAKHVDVSPNQVNWSQHRRMSLLLILYDLRAMLTQKFWKQAQGGAPGMPDVTDDRLHEDVQLLTDTENALSFGSKYFGMHAPTEADEIELMFQDMCVHVKTANCSTDSNGINTHGLHAGIIEFINQARLSETYIHWALKDPLSKKVVLPNGLVNVTAAHKYMHELAHIFHMPSMDWLAHMSETHLARGLEVSGRMFEEAVESYVHTQAVFRWVTLIAFIVICFFMFVGFYNPMCWQLDRDQKRTTSMLLLIPNEITERLPSVREFIQKLEG